MRGGDRLVDPDCHRRPGLRRQGCLPVDPGGPAPSVALRHLPHADQRVRPGPQHHLLQGPELSPVLLPRRREDPLPQPRYVLLVGTPVNGVPLQPALRSVHHHGCLTCPSVRSAAWHRALTGSPGSRQLPFGPGNSRYPAGYPGPALEGDGMLAWFPAAFRPPAFASRPSFPAWYSAPLAIGLPAPAAPDHGVVSTVLPPEM